MSALNDSSSDLFGRWVTDVFGRVPGDWYPKALDFSDWSELSPHEILAFLARALNSPNESFGRFDDDSIALGLLCIVHPSYTNWAATLLDEDLPLSDRECAINGTVTLFRQFVAKRLTPSKNLKSIIYMWWDLFPSWGSEDAATDRAILHAMTQILALDCRACQDSALHGLNHWQSNYPVEVSAIIDSYLARNLNLAPELIRSAHAAKTGAIQ